MDFDAIFDGKAKDTPEAAKPAEAQPPIEQVTPPAAEPTTDLAAAAPPEPAPTPDLAPQERTAPLTALLDERDKRKAAERERDELRAAASRPPAAIPDPYDDPAGYQAHVAQLVNAQALNLKFDLSESMAREKHGDDTVTAAMEWALKRAQTNPGFQQEYLSQRNPIDWAVRQQRRDGLLAAVGDDEEAFVRRRAAELGLIAAPDAGAGAVPVPEQQQAPKAPAPPRSIASAPNAGGGPRDVPTGPLAALEAVFPR